MIGSRPGRRRGVHSLVAVSLLIGMTTAMVGILLAVLGDHADIAANNAQCALDFTLYDTGDDAAYMVASLHNLGSGVITSADISFIDDHGVERGFADSGISIPPGESWDVMDSLAASVSGGDGYGPIASVTMDDGSMIGCTSGV